MADQQQQQTQAPLGVDVPAGQTGGDISQAINQLGRWQTDIFGPGPSPPTINPQHPLDAPDRQTMDMMSGMVGGPEVEGERAFNQLFGSWKKPRTPAGGRAMLQMLKDADKNMPRETKGDHPMQIARWWGSTDPYPRYMGVPTSGKEVEEYAAKHGQIPPEQREQNLRDFLGNSVLRRADGSPIPIYHGTNQALDRFDFSLRHTYGHDPGWLGQAFYFWNSPELAGYYNRLKGDVSRGDPHIIPVYARVENPYLMDVNQRLLLGARMNEIMERDGNQAAWDFSEEITRMLMDEGHDGVIVPWFRRDPRFKGVYETAVFHPGNIKSATSNIGTYSRFDPRLSYAVGGLSGAANQQQQP